MTDLTGGTASGPDDAELVALALRDWSDALGGRLQFHFVEHESDALLKVRFLPPGRDRYGEAMPISVDGRRGAAVFIRTDTSSLGRAISRRAARIRFIGRRSST